VFHNLFTIEVPLKEFFVSRQAPTSEKVYRSENKEAVVGARSLLQYCQFPEKVPCYVLRDIWNFLTYFETLINGLINFFTIFHETPHNFLLNAGWEILFCFPRKNNQYCARRGLFLLAHWTWN